jgi:hypothetical protein
LRVSTVALKSETPGDATYTELEDAITALTDERDALAHDIRQALDDAAFAGKSINVRAAQSMIAQAKALIGEIQATGH